MTALQSLLADGIRNWLHQHFQHQLTDSALNFQETRPEFEGDITVVVFPFTKITGQGPELTGQLLGAFLVEHIDWVTGFNVVKGFLNLNIRPEYFLNEVAQLQPEWPIPVSGKPFMVEFASPNTNKPLHLGHIRNILLGDSLCRILAHNGTEVLRLCLYNDRGIHICKSMLAWKKFGNGETPESSGLKGDHLIGKYYVVFDQKNREQAEPLIATGIEKDAAVLQTELTREAQEMLRLWEEGDEDTVALWKKMNDWVYGGFNETFRRLGVHFNHLYFESQTYLLGKSIVQEGFEKGVFYQKEDGSVWIDLTADGLDHKLVLRADGTSVYITQDIGTATERFNTFDAQACVYVVGNEQDYHFKVLKLIMKHLGRPWADQLHHFSYGMIELPSGKMKSREGTVVDADDLIDEMEFTAAERTRELGKIDGLSEAEAQDLFHVLGMGALKYFLLKVDPKKKMLFNPEESIDFQGNTGPFLQYTHARIAALRRRALAESIDFNGTWNADLPLQPAELKLVKVMLKFRTLVSEAAQSLSPALLANYAYDLATAYNKFYHDLSVFNEPDADIRRRRLQLSDLAGRTLAQTLELLGIEAPQQM